MTLIDDLLADPIILFISLIVSAIITLLPIIVLGIPELILRHYEKKKNAFRLTKAIYYRFYLGFILFWILYYILPAILNFIVPNEQAFSQVQVYHYPSSDPRYSGPKFFSTIWNPNDYDFFKYVGQLIANSIVLYLQYPLLILPPVFVVGSILALFILLIQVYQRTRDVNIINMAKGATTEQDEKDDETTVQEFDEDDPNAPLMDASAIREAQARTRKMETLGENLEQLSHDLPSEKILDEIVERVQSKNYQNEKELFQIIMAVLPISLFLLMSLLKILGQVENPTILQGTPMGWFLEIFFVYLATIVFSVYLLKACNFSLKGDPGVSSRLYQSMYQSLVTVGAFMSVIASILFLVEFPEQIFVVIYFIIYFIMVTTFFVLFLDIFEPISRYFLYQLLNAMKKSQMISNVVPQERFLYRALSPIKWASFIKSLTLATIKGFGKRINRTTIKMLIITIAVLLVLSLAEFSGNAFFSFIYANFDRLYAQSFFFNVTLYLKLAFLVMLALYFRKYNWSVTRNVVFIFTVALLYSAFSGFLYIFLPRTEFFATNPALQELISSLLYPLPSGKGLIPIFFPTFVTFVNFIFLGSEKNYWITAILKFGIYHNVLIITTETFFVESGFTGAGQDLLGLLSAPYILFRELTVLVFLALFIHLLQVNHIIKTIHHPEKQNILTKTVLSQRWSLPPPDVLINQSNSYRLTLTDLGKSLEWKVLTASLEVLTSTLIEDRDPSKMTFEEIFQLSNQKLTHIHGQPIELTLDEFWKAMSLLASTRPIARMYRLLDDQDNYIENYLEFFMNQTRSTQPRTETQVSEHLKYKIEYQSRDHHDVLLKKLQTFIQINKYLFQHPESSPSFVEVSNELNTSVADLRNDLIDLYLMIPGFKRYLTFLGEEFGYSYEEVALDSLHIMMIDGRSIFTFLFREESVVEPALVAGLFAAITSFAQEAVQSKELLRSIDHGDVFLTIEYGRNILAAVFSDKASSEIRRKLQQFVKEFEQRHASELKDWLGDQSLFFKDVELVREIFEIDEDVGQLVT